MEYLVTVINVNTVRVESVTQGKDCVDVELVATFHGVAAEQAAKHYCHVMSNTCIAKLVIGEPFFVVRGQDSLGPTVVRGWAFLAAQNRVPLEKILEANHKAGAMEDWPKKKLPD